MTEVQEENAPEYDFSVMNTKMDTKIHSTHAYMLMLSYAYACAYACVPSEYQA